MVEYASVMFVWRKEDTIQSFTADGPITYEKALERAVRWGYAKARWYRPSTWGSYVVKFPLQRTSSFEPEQKKT